MMTFGTQGRTRARHNPRQHGEARGTPRRGIQIGPRLPTLGGSVGKAVGKVTEPIKRAVSSPLGMAAIGGLLLPGVGSALGGALGGIGGKVAGALGGSDGFGLDDVGNLVGIGSGIMSGIEGKQSMDRANDLREQALTAAAGDYAARAPLRERGQAQMLAAGQSNPFALPAVGQSPLSPRRAGSLSSRLG